MNTLKTSSHLKDIKIFNVEIIVTGSNTTAYQIKQTQGAEFGEEAETVRLLFESALKQAFAKEENFEAECEDCDWKGNKEDMDEDEDDTTLICPDCGSDKIYYFK